MGGAGVVAFALLCAACNLAPTVAQIGECGGRLPPLFCVGIYTLLCIPPFFSIPRTVFLAEPQDAFTAVGSAALFNCSVTAPNQVSVAWVREGVMVIQGTRFAFLDNSSLRINPVEQSDEGEYRCRVTNSLTQEVEERSATLSVACEIKL